MIKFYIQESWLLLAAALIFGLTLAGFNAAWSEEIERNQQAKFIDKAQKLLPEAMTFEIAASFDIQTPKGVVTTDIRKAKDASGNTIGWAFVCEGPGFADKIKLVVATDAEFKTVAGFDVLASNETPNFGDKIAHDFFNNQYKGIPVGQLTLLKVGDDKKIDSDIIAITGATISSDAVVKMFNNFLPEIQKQLKAKGLI